MMFWDPFTQTETDRKTENEKEERSVSMQQHNIYISLKFKFIKKLPCVFCGCLSNNLSIQERSVLRFSLHVIFKYK